jgi:DHA1 family bicyclomycin/chloramphenicol resistance-like MFS transporter
MGLHAAPSSPPAPALSAAKASHHRGLAVLLAAMAAIGPFATDTYLPSFREIGHEFGASPVLVQQTLTAYMVPFAAMTLWQGAISDALGRRRVTLAMLALFFLASLGCMASWSISALIGFRMLQGMTAGAGMIIGRAIVRDVVDGPEARRLMSHIAVMFAIAPALGPIIGGWLHVWFGWRSVFAFIALFTATLWLCCWRSLPETLPPARRLPLHAGQLLRGYWQALRSAPFCALVLAVTLNFSALFLYIVSAPAFLLGLLHVKETEFYWLFGPITAGMLIGTWLSAQLAGRLNNHRTVLLSYGFMVTAALGNFAFHSWHTPALPWSILPLVVYVVGSSLSMPSLTLMALDLFPERRGLASSCQGFVQSSGNALATALLAPLLWGTALALSAGMLALLAGGAVAFLVYAVLPHRQHATAVGVQVHV